MNDIEEFQKNASVEIKKTRKEITESCRQELGQYRELYNKLHKSFKTKRLVYLFSTTFAFSAVSIFLWLCYFMDFHFIIIYDFTSDPVLVFGFSFVGGIILLWAIISSEDRITDQVYGNSALGEIRSSVEENIEKIIKENISPETRKGLVEVAQAIEKSRTFFYQDFVENASRPSLNFYYYFRALRYGGNQDIVLYFNSSFSFKGKTWHGLSSYTCTTFDESLNYTFKTRDRVF